jgi:leader peptidase (prepilin peptidase)/N-methyltransferase
MTNLIELTILTILYALIGWLVAIAINHAADILPTRQTLRQWPSCAACGTRRPYWTWSALLAYLRGHQACHHCEQRRESLVRSLIVELITPAFFVFLLRQYELSLHLGLVSLYTAILILITVTDLEHRLIFNVVILPSILLGITAAFFTPGLFWPSALVGGAIAFILSYLAALFARGGFGGGDVTLSTFLGLIIGFPHILFSLTLGVFLGGFVAFLLLITRQVGLKTFIPYGPFLTTTGWIMLIWGPEIWGYYF